MYNKRMFRIILSSPSDLQAERKIVMRVVDEINGLYKSTNIGLDLVMWETDVPPRTDLQPGQKNIDEVLHYESVDLLIGLFYKKLGTPTLGAESGTVHEIDEAINSFKERQSPEIKLYFKEATFTKAKKEELSEYLRLQEKKEQYMKLGGIVQEFKTTAEFEKNIRKHIMWFVEEKGKAYSKDGKLLSDPIVLRDSQEIEAFPTVTAIFANLESYLKNRSAESDPEVIYGFGVDMQVALPNLEHLIKSYAKNITFKILTISPDTHTGEAKFTEGGNYDPDTLNSAITRLKKVTSQISANGNRIIIKTTDKVYPFHGMVIKDELYVTWIMISGKDTIISTRPFIKIQKGIQPVMDNLYSSFETWFEYYWDESNDLYDSDNPATK